MQDNDPINMTYGQLSDMVNRIEQIPPLSGAGAPTSSTPAFYLGQTYIDTSTGKAYYCEEIQEESGTADTFIWRETGRTYTAGQNITITGNEISATVPTKTSDLTNDGADGTSTFVEADELATVATSGSYNDLSNKPTIPTVNNATLTIQRNGSQVGTFTANASSNSTVNITVPTNNNQLTNGAGYQTSSDVNAAIASAVAGITSFSYEVVAELPAYGEKGVIYLVASEDSGDPSNVYEEYLWIEDDESGESEPSGYFELIGSTEMDLSNYATKTYVDEKIGEIETILARLTTGSGIEEES